MRFVHACAGRSAAHRSSTGVQPATARVPIVAPTATLTSANV